MAGAGVTQSICLPLLSVYQLSTNGTIQVGVASFIPAGNAPGELPMPSQAVAGAMPSQGGRIAATPRDWTLLDWCGGEKNHLFLCVICSDVCFIPEVPGCPLLARGLSPLHVPDGTSSQNTEIQLPDRSAGLCGCSSREDPSGVPRTASVLHLAHVFQQQWK